MADNTSQVAAGIGGARRTFELGDVTIHLISDGGVPYPTEMLFPDAPQDELRAGLAGRLDQEGHLPVPYYCLLITTPERNVLVDAGIGPETAAAMGFPAGRVLDSLTGAGVAVDDIDTVIVSHAHGDHIGGLVNAGAVTFPRARHVIEAEDWAYWTDENELARLPGILAGIPRVVLPALAEADVVDVVGGETEVVPGVRLLPARGHTPGHCVVSIGSGSEQAIYLGDAVLDELNLTHPTWVSSVETRPEEAVASRTRLLDDAARQGTLTFAFHLPEPGYIERHDGRYVLTPA